MILLPTPPPAAPAFIDKAKTLRAQSFLDNRDYDWYQANVPFFESPDQDVDATYYYLWELVTKHLVYGSPSSGYAFTEFIDRPGWSGTYGAISCAAGLQLYEVRWLRNPRYAQDYARYWFRTPGAQPYNYSTWLADSVWAVYKVGLDADFAKGLLPDLKEYFAEWTRRQFVPEVGLFWQTGMRDGMETNINSRQTVDWFAGAPGYRPTFNSYMFADARGIAAIARLAGETETASLYEKKAADLREKALSLMWDPQRQFFMHVFKNDERDGIKALTKTHETGKFAGSPYGRELIGYVPWQFEMADARFAGAWSFLMDPQRFFAPFGPTVTERNDPLFKISPRCCEWSGNSWPYATTQTLAAMANLLQGAPQRVVTNEQYFRLLKTYTMTQRKAGKPYIAESAHPDTGSWEGSDNYDHSEHYFHSNYNDLIITGLVGLRPRADDTVELRPLAPKAWDYFALEDVPYHGRKLAVVWDRDGKRYGRGKGLSVFADGKRIANSPNLGPLSAKLAPGKIVSPSRSINYAVNNEGTFFPRVAASSSDPKAPVGKAVDGNYWYLTSPPNRWASAAGSKTDWLSVNFGTPRSVREVRLYLLEDGPGGAVRAPRSYRLQSWEKG
ncbi:carbohydrate-binding protein, partial [bacterium]